MADENKIFRQVALDRISSPDHLDRLVAVTDGRGWLLLVTLGMLIAALIAWAWYGAIPTQVQAQGILINRDSQVADAMTPGSGVLTDITVALNSHIKKGDVVANIRQALIEQRLTSTRELVAERSRELKVLEESNKRVRKGKVQNFKEQKATLRESITFGEVRLEASDSRLTKMEQFEEGTIPQVQLEEARTEVATIRQEIADSRNDILGLDANELDLITQQDESLRRVQQSLAEAQRSQREMERQLEQESRVIAPIDGRVTEIKLSEGNVVTHGQAVLSIEGAGEGLEALLFISTAHGKKVIPNMDVRIEPAAFRKEEYGALIGKASWISDFPVSREGLGAKLQNQALVESYFREGAPYEVRVDLVRDEQTPSGYRWTSGKGPQSKITSGSTVLAKIVIKEQRPAEMVIPLLKHTVGMN
ncbi:MAG: NHLP bacteriocin system secretion protein [Gammaproteobacteria bacterium]|jgi:HlyD family secretion protein|nr:NHLP bacteriocin system secretion protein [Gammaproteobacteria bacterium]MDP6098260.1 NHLP bacteriocin system secretion protein [Gammaproteobacteria bacterium]|tara:strand:+ start:5032 stop:6291 length:1260 start_codon:yes stop_codon:yes gene_type:complete